MARFSVALNATIQVYAEVEADTAEQALKNWTNTKNDVILAVCEMAPDLSLDDFTAISAELEED